MKNDLISHQAVNGYRYTYFILFVISAFLLFSHAGTAQDKKEPPAKIGFIMKLSPISSNGNRSVKLRLSRKEDGKTIMIDDLRTPVNLYLNEVKAYNPDSLSGWISKIYINNDGEGVFEFPSNFNQATAALHEFTFIAKMDSDPKYEDAEERVTVADVKISMAYSGADSIKTATATLLAWKGSDYVALPQVELKLCIKRAFNFLPFGESGATTDSTGNISGDLPIDIPGNSNRTLTIAARLEDDDTYGTVEVTKDVPWAVLPRVNPIRGRTLWSQGDNAPLLLVITSLTIIIIIWGTIIYLIYLLFRIKRLSKSA